MRFVMMMKATTGSAAGVMPSEQLRTELGRYHQELVKAGVLLAGEDLYPSSEGVRIRVSGTQRIVTGGPFEEAHEIAAGFWLVQVRSKDEVLEWARRCPNPVPGESEIEIHRCFEPDDGRDARARELLAPEERRSDGRA